MPKSILLVDDSTAVRKRIAAALVGAGYAVTEAATGMEALERLKSGSHDLLLLDLNLPQLSGFEILRLVKSGGPIRDLPVLCITGMHRDLADIQKLRELGAAGYIDKESSQEDILFRINQVLGKKP